MGTHGMVSQKKSEEVWVTRSINSATIDKLSTASAECFPTHEPHH
jgi:hypothetical protein